MAARCLHRKGSRRLTTARRVACLDYALRQAPPGRGLDRLQERHAEAWTGTGSPGLRLDRPASSDKRTFATHWQPLRSQAEHWPLHGRQSVAVCCPHRKGSNRLTTVRQVAYLGELLLVASPLTSKRTPHTGSHSSRCQAEHWQLNGRQSMAVRSIIQEVSTVSPHGSTVDVASVSRAAYHASQGGRPPASLRFALR